MIGFFLVPLLKTDMISKIKDGLFMATRFVSYSVILSFLVFLIGAIGRLIWELLWMGFNVSNLWH